MNSVHYVSINRQRDTDGCREKDFRHCGNMSVDVPLVIRHLHEAVQRARCPAGDGGWPCEMALS